MNNTVEKTTKQWGETPPTLVEIILCVGSPTTGEKHKWLISMANVPRENEHIRIYSEDMHVDGKVKSVIWKFADHTHINDEDPATLQGNVVSLLVQAIDSDRPVEQLKETRE